MTQVKDKYREETNKDIYHKNPQDAGAWCYTTEYVKWLEQHVIRLFAIPDVSCLLCARGITQKMLDAENYVKKYIDDYKRPPTYRQVAKDFNIAVCAAHARLRHCRYLMKRKKIKYKL